MVSQPQNPLVTLLIAAVFLVGIGWLMWTIGRRR
jgi:hypothetical protein